MKLGLREIVFIALLMAVPVGAWWFVFRPNNQQQADARAEIEKKQQRLRDLNKATANIGDLKKEIQSLEKALDYFQAKLPSEKEIDKVLKEVWLLAERNELITKSIRTRDRSDNESFGPAGAHSEQPIVMKLVGDYDGFYSFLQELENQPRIMRIRSMKLHRMDKGPNGHVLADFEISIFFEKT